MIFIQRVATPDKRQYGYKRVPSKDEGPRDYKMLWQNAIKQTVILGKNLNVSSAYYAMCNVPPQVEWREKMPGWFRMRNC